MLIEQIWTGNAYRNFNYLLACPETGEAMAIDPLDYDKCLSKAKEKGWEITQILNTHEHGDHTGGNHAVIEATGAKLIAHENASGKIDGMDQRKEAQVVNANVPLSNMFGYVTDLRSITQGRAVFHMEFSHFQQVPNSVQDEIIERVHGKVS